MWTARTNIISLTAALLILCSISVSGQDSRNGYWFPPRDTLRIFVIYAELLNDPDDPQWIRGWVPGSLPPDPGYLFDHKLSPGDKPSGVITKYYYQASFGEYVVLADHYPEIVSLDYNSVRSRGIEQVMRQVAGTGDEDIITANGYSVNRGDFDFISTSRMGLPKSTEPDSLIDIVMVIWRVNSRMTKDLSAGFCVPAKRMQVMKGMKGMNSYSSFVNKDYTRYTIIRHEFSHLLLGGNNFHTGGAGAGTKTFMSDAGGYAMLSSHLMSSPVYCSFDRRRLGWKLSGNEYQISARNPVTGSEVDGDLVYGQAFPEGSDEFLLRDFVSTGDAIRIELPYVHDATRKIRRQWLWLENHQKLDGNIDHEKATRKGLYAYIQVDKESLSGSDAYGGLCNYTWPVSAFGNFDFRINEESGESEVDPGLSNPFTGYNNLIYGVYDLGQKDELIFRNEVFLAKRVKFNGSYPDSANFNYETYPLFGTSFDAFRPGEKIGIDRNPAAVPLLTYRTGSSPRARPGNPNNSDNRIIHLNGLSVEFIEQLPDGSIKLKIRWDDHAIGRDVRWCGDIQLHEELIIEKGNSVLLDRGLTPTRPKDPVEFRGEKVFSDPTSFTLKDNAAIQLERRSKVRVESGSGLFLEKGSHIHLERGARILIDRNSSLVVQPGAVISGKGKIILEPDSSAELHENSVKVRVRYLR